MLSRLKTSVLFSGAATYLVSNILNAAIPFLLLPLLTRHLGPAGYGEVAMFMAVLGALEACVGLSVAGAAGRQYYDGQLDAQALRDFIASGLQLLLATALLAAGVLWVLRKPLAQALELQPRWLPWAVLVSACGVVINIRLGQWQVRHEARRFGALQVAQGLLNMVLSLLLVLGLGQGADGRITAQVATAAGFALLALVLLRRDGLLGFWVWRPAYQRQAVAFGLPLVPHFAGLFLLNVLDRVLVNAELGLAEAGVYMVAVQLANAMGLVFDALNKAYGPWLYERLRRDLPDEKRRIVRWTYAWFVAVLLGAALAFNVGPGLVGLIAGERFAHAGEVIGWLALGQAFNGMYFMVTNYIFYSRRTGALALATVSAGVAHVGLLVALVPAWGIEGAGMAFSISMGLRFLLTWWVAQRRHPMPWLQAVVAGSS